MDSLIQIQEKCSLCRTWKRMIQGTSCLTLSIPTNNDPNAHCDSDLIMPYIGNDPGRPGGISSRKRDMPNNNTRLDSNNKFKRKNRFFRNYPDDYWAGFCDEANDLTLRRFLDLIKDESGPQWDERRQMLLTELRERCSQF